MNPIHQVWTAAVQTAAFNHSANLACLQKSKVLCAATEQLPCCCQSIQPQSWGAPGEGGQRLNHIFAAQQPPIPNTTLMPQKQGCGMSCPTKASKQENKRVFPASILILGGREGICSGFCFQLLQPDPCLGSVLYSDPDMVSAKGIHQYSQYCSRIPALRGTACSDAAPGTSGSVGLPQTNISLAHFESHLTSCRVLTISLSSEYEQRGEPLLLS